MLPLHKMVMFFQSVAEDWTSPIADAIASRWAEAVGKKTCVRASANYVFHVDGGEQGYILRFNHASERSVAWIQSELAFLAYLHERGIHVNQAYPSRNGKLVESVPTEQGLFHAVLLEMLPGEHQNPEEMDAPALRRWGRALGQLHRASEGYAGEDRPGWRQLFSTARLSVPRNDAALQDAVARLEERLNSLPADPVHFGVIHYDFESDNIRWDAGSPGIMDLDDSCRAWYGADIAYALRDLAPDPYGAPDRKDERFLAFLCGYRSVRSIADGELDNLSLYMNLHQLLSYARLQHTLAGDVSPDEPQWALDLRAKLAPRVEELKDRLRSFQAFDGV